jgi:LysR family transcriptional regulator for bpeEF and oprC
MRQEPLGEKLEQLRNTVLKYGTISLDFSSLHDNNESMTKSSVDLNRAYWFVKIIDAGNISRAAEIYQEPKAKLSRALALLEAELGIQLVYRTTRQFKLTDSGLVFYRSCKEHIEGMLTAVADLKKEGQEISGHLKITAPDDIGVYVLNKIIDEFSALYPKVTFEMIYTNQILDLVKLGVDVAIRIGQMKDSTLIQKRVGMVSSILVASPRYLSKNPRVSTPDDLIHHHTIGFSSRAGAWDLISRNKKKKVNLKHKAIANNYIAIKDLTLQGHGIAYIPRFLCGPHLSNGELVQVLKNWTDEGSPIQIAVPHQKNISRKSRLFMDFASKRLSQYF